MHAKKLQLFGERIAYTITRNLLRKAQWKVRGNVKYISLFPEQPKKNVFRKSVNLLNEGMNEQKNIFLCQLSWGAPLTKSYRNSQFIPHRGPKANGSIVPNKCNKVKNLSKAYLPLADKGTTVNL